VLFLQLQGKCQGKTRKDGARTVLNVVWLLFVLFCVVFVCKCVLPPGDNPIAVNKYIISYHKTVITFRTLSFILLYLHLAIDLRLCCLFQILLITLGFPFCPDGIFKNRASYI
jgi:hypothetical protein